MGHPGFVAASEATDNRVVDNVARGNGTVPLPGEPFDFARSDLALLTSDTHGNCLAGNVYDTFFSLSGPPPACP